MRHRRWRKWLWILAAVLVIVYLAGANFLVSAALVPSTMEKLDAFSRITEDSYEALVQTDDIQQQNAKAWDETREWAEKAHGQKLGEQQRMATVLLLRRFFQRKRVINGCFFFMDILDGKRQCILLPPGTMKEDIM